MYGWMNGGMDDWADGMNGMDGADGADRMDRMCIIND